ncbi:acyl-CoA thioesterase [Bradyrhizobium cytisi]|uniref:Acyl-CoA thioesterase 2 n=1 Tax=Bradyrhizobium cytisi TaxID=515489 RepID=A0A5S4WBF7_9BRAD|nr:acyl-CoA thioesterase II [Bradyrhizobium cytisi]TYL71760.1 acyl-CoA thioesterase II [Bradyrhizobium cytisi]
MSKFSEDSLAILDLEPLGANLFRGVSQNPGLQPVYGGQLIGQSVIAACRTVEKRIAHSLHGYFIKPGDPHVPILYKVEAVRDGKSYSMRRVTAIQHGNPIFSAVASFHAGEENPPLDHQDPMPGVPPPEDLTIEKLSKQPLFAKLPERIRRWYDPRTPVELPDRPIDLRPVEIGHHVGLKSGHGRVHYWFKVAAKLPDDPAFHLGALAYASDWSLLDAATARYGRSLFDRRILPVTLDHAIWFHRPFRADDWLLFAQESPSAQRGRCFTRGLIFKRDGTLVASVAQEASMRERR